MVERKLRIIWDIQAKESFIEILSYIKNESPQGVNIVKTKILESIRKLPSNPKMFETDRFKKNNNGDYRAFTIYCYRIAYKITKETIEILRVRHTSQEPLEY